jgi:hypothetical protein
MVLVRIRIGIQNRTKVSQIQNTTISKFFISVSDEITSPSSKKAEIKKYFFL